MRSKLRLNWRCWNRLTEKLIDWYSKFLEILQNPVFFLLEEIILTSNTQNIWKQFAVHIPPNQKKTQQTHSPLKDIQLGGWVSPIPPLGTPPLEECPEEAKWLRLGNIRLFVQETLRKGFSTHLGNQLLAPRGFGPWESTVFLCVYLWGGTQNTHKSDVPFKELWEDMAGHMKIMKPGKELGRKSCKAIKGDVNLGSYYTILPTSKIVWYQYLNLSQKNPPFDENDWVNRDLWSHDFVVENQVMSGRGFCCFHFFAYCWYCYGYHRDFAKFVWASWKNPRETQNPSILQHWQHSGKVRCLWLPSIGFSFMKGDFDDGLVGFNDYCVHPFWFNQRFAILVQ